MRDVIVLAIIAVFFALCVAYVRWCDRIIGPDPDDLRTTTSTSRRPGAVDRAGRSTPIDAGRRRRGGAVVIAAAVDNWIGLGIAGLLAIYLVLVLVFPERF